MSSVDSRFEQWKGRLLDLSKRNRLLFFKQTRRGNVQLIEPDADEIFKWLVKDEKKLIFAEHASDQLEFPLEPLQSETSSLLPQPAVPLRPGELGTSLTGHQLALTLYNIRSRARTALEEQGVNVLYLTFGMLDWYETETSNELVRSPLVLVPVELTRASIAKPYVIELLDEDILLNPTLTHKLQTDFHLLLPSLPEDWTTNTLEETLGQVREVITDQPRWSVSPEVHLGLFSFEKLVMLKDLESNAQAAKQHLLVAALGGDRSKIPTIPSDIPLAEELDEKVRPEDTFQVLDADSSQQEAIVLAKRGISFVIQGPPGTGKSQTIANIISELLAEGKRVLFVSEKMAALEVVSKRLAESGLDEFCLEAHSHKANKGVIITQLGKALNAAISTNADSFEAELRQVADLRTKLDRYADALHTAYGSLRRTPYQIHGQLAVLAKIPDLNFQIENVVQVDAEQFRRMHASLDALLAESDVWDNYATHPWRGTLIHTFSFQNQTDIQTHFIEFIHCLDEMESSTEKVAALFGLRPPKNLDGVESFSRMATCAIESPFPPSHWLVRRDTVGLKQETERAKQVYEDLQASRAKLLTTNSEAIVGFDDLPQLISRFETSYRSVFRIFNSEYRRDLQRIRATAVGQPKIDYGKALATLRLAHNIQADQQWIAAQQEQHEQLFGHYFEGPNTRWDTILAALDWTARFLAYFPRVLIPETLIALVCQQSQSFETARELVSVLDELLKHSREELAFLGTVFPLEQMKISGMSVIQAPLSQLKVRLQYRLDHLDDLKKWIDFESAWKDCEQQNLGTVLHAAIAAKVKADQLIPAFDKRFYRLWLDSVYRDDPVLTSFSGDRQSKLIDQFRSLDREQVRIARNRVTAKLAAMRPKISWVEAPSSEVMILRRELEKKKRHKPIRKLFAEIPNLLFVLKPCLMMSPLSVSQFLSANHFEFDTIIFDEASQICPEDAIGSIMRSKQAIIAGDRHQLPPTPFFRSLGIDFDEWNDEESGEVLESVLQECAIFMPNQMLKWHYRSRHESLIAFSNHHLYDDLLITFPNSQLTGEEFGIEFVYVPQGIYDRGKSRKNRIEAQRVAQLILEHFNQFPERSLGVVAFSEAQREAIDEELQQAAHEDADFDMYLNQKGPEAFFVKNLENVQGDERDVIFFSVGYGKDAVGKLTMNFGPLNGEDGARRLNVAITRARFHVKLVSSILPDDIDAGYVNTGVQLLRNYMAYARQAGSRESLYGETSSSPVAEAESPFETAVYQALSERGLTLHRQVGCSGYRIDLGVVDPEHPGRYLLGVECDGATYHSAKTARDRDRLRQQVLEELGWRIHRVWSRDWIANPAMQTQKILDALHMVRQSNRLTLQPLQRPSHSNQPLDYDRSSAAIDDAIAQPSVSSASIILPDSVHLYNPTPLPRLGDQTRFNREDNQAIAQVLKKIVEHEGPIHIRLAARRLAPCWGITKVGKRIEGRIAYIARNLATEKAIVIRDEFLWPINMLEPIVRQPVPGEPPRAIDEIAIEEIGQAALLCLRDAFSLSKEDLIRQTARLLGYDRTGEKVHDRILLSVNGLLLDKKAKVANDKVELLQP